METHLPAITACMAGSAMLALILWYLYRQKKKQYIGLWGLAWFVTSLRFAVLIGKADTADALAQNPLDHLLVSIGGLLVIWGIWSFISKSFSYWWAVAILAGWVWQTIGSVLQLPELTYTLPFIALLSSFYIWTSVALVTTHVIGKLGKWLTGISLTLLGIVKLITTILAAMEYSLTSQFVIFTVLGALFALGLISMTFDRMRGEDRLGEQRFRLIAQNARDVIFRFRVKPDLGFEYVTPSIYDLLGYHPHELQGSNEIWLKLISPDDLSDSLSLFSQPENITHLLAINLLHKNGSVVPTEQRLVPVQDEQGQLQAIEGICRDVTERKEAEFEREKLRNQLERSQKMEALGTLAGGVAHDMNNMLAAIMGIASLLARRAGTNNPNIRHVEAILAACGQARDLTKNLLGFARKEVTSKELISFNEIVDQVVILLGRTLPKQIEITTDPETDLHAIEGDASQLKHALMNLCLNAADAIESDGTITVATRNIVSDQEVTDQPKSNQQIAVTITDTGKGMDASTVDRAFEPFFTTKPMGEGTGLGLAMVYGTVHSHKGSADITSKPAKGTTVTLTFPAIEDSVSSQKSSSVSTEFARLKGTVLVVDDEPLVRAATCEMLIELGFDTLQAQSGQRACEIVGANGQEISLVVLDIAMPGMNGIDTCEQLKKINPSLNVLLASGYSRQTLPDDVTTVGASGFLQKPFNLHELNSSVSRATRNG